MAKTGGRDVNKYATEKSRRKGGNAILKMYGRAYFVRLGKKGRKTQLHKLKK